MVNRFKKYLIFCTIFFISFFIVLTSSVYAAGEHHFSFSAFDFDPINGTGTGNDILGSADVEPGDVFGLRVLYTNGTTPIANLQYAFTYDKNLVEPLTDAGVLISEFDDSTTYEGGIWPSKGTTTISLRNNTNWTYMDNLVVDSSQIRGIVEDSTNNSTLTVTNGILVTYYFKVLDTATPGATINFNYLYSGYADTAVEGNLPVSADSFSLSVYGQMSGDTSLSSFTVKNGVNNYLLNPVFTAGSSTRTYSTVVPYGTSSIDIASTANEGHALVLGDGNATKSLVVGNNTFQFVVTAQNGTLSTYTLNVKRLSNDANLNSITLSNGINIGTFNSNTYTYNASVLYAVSSTNITGVTSNANATITSGTGTWDLSNYGAVINTKTITVQAENCKSTYSTVIGNTCDSKNYIINVTRGNPSTNSYLSDIKIDGTTIPLFDKDTLNYSIGNVSNSTSQINLTATVMDTGLATITSGTGIKNLNLGLNTFQIVVKAEDNTTKTYSIDIYRLSNNSKLKTLTVNSTPLGTLSPSFSSTFYDYYTYNYDYTVNSLDVNATLDDSKAVITSGVGTYTSSDTTANIVVTAEDGTVSTYIVKLVRGKSTNNNLSSLTITGVNLNETFANSTTLYTTTVLGNVSSIEVNATVEDNRSTIISGTGTHSLNYGNNSIQVRVQSEAGVVKDYTINIVRQMKDIATLDDLKVDGTTVSSYNKDTYNYDIGIVPYSKNSIVVSGTKTDADATVNGFKTVNLTTGINVIPVVVTAHDGVNKKTYNITVTREKNNDVSLNGLKVFGITPVWNSTDSAYELTVTNDKTVLNPTDVVVTPTDTNATVTKDASINLVTTSDNYYNFKIVAENQVTESNVKIKIIREKSSNNTLSSVTISSGAFNGNCNIVSNKCSVSVPSSTTNFTVNAIASDSLASVVGNGEYNLATSSMDVVLNVTAENSSVASYTITVIREKSTNANLSLISVDGVNISTFSPSIVNYSVSVLGDVTSINIDAIVEDTNKATITSGLGSHSLNYGSNLIEVRVLAENGTSDKVYTINVTRQMKTIATLDDLKIDGTTILLFDKEIISYDLGSVPYTKNSLVISGVTTDADATVVGFKTVALNTGINTIPVVVTAHDGVTKKIYNITVLREKNNNTAISGLKVFGITPVWNSTDLMYELTVANSKTLVSPGDVAVTLVDSNATITKDLVTNLSTTSDNYYNVKVTAENGVDNYTYIIKIIREKGSDATLATLSVTDGSFSPSFTPSTNTYSVTVPTSTTSFTVSGTKTDSMATINSGLATFDLTSSNMQVQVIVTAEDGITTKTYYLNITRIASSDNKLKSLTVLPAILNQTFNPDTTLYTATVAGDIANIDVVAELNDSKATIVSGLGVHTLNVGDNNIIIRTKAESGATKDYTVIITRQKKNIATLIDIKVDGITISGFNKDVYEYTLGDVIYSKSSVNITAVTTDNDANVNGVGIKTLSTGANALKLVVTAQDLSTKTYTININRSKNDVASLQMLSYLSYSLSPVFNSGVLNYDVVVPNTVTMINASDITAVSKDINATVVKDQQLNLSTASINVYNLTVTSENGLVTTNYKLNITRQKSSDTTLKSITTTNASLSPVFTPQNRNYTLTIPFGVTDFSINSIVNNLETHVIGNGNYTVGVGDVSDGVINLVTTAEDGTTATYTLNIVTALSNDATLSSLSVNGYSLNKAFTSTSLTYDIGEIPYTTTQLLVNAVSNNANATIQYYIGDSIQASNTVDIPQIVGENYIRVTVTAHDGVTKSNYKIYYRIINSSNSFLSDLGVSKGELLFNKTTYSYIVNVDNSVTSLDLSIVTEDPNSTYTVNQTGYLTSGVVPINNLVVGNNTYTIVVTAQDDAAIKTYNVVIVRALSNANSDATLSSLSISGYPFVEDFSSNLFEYYNIGDISYSLTNLQVNATPTYGESTIKYIVNGIVQSGSNVVLPKTNGLGTIEVLVTAEDNTTTNTYKIRYSKQASNNAYLSSINLSNGVLNFSKNTTSYNIDYSLDVTSVDMSLIAEDSNAKIKINNITYTSPQTKQLTLVQGKNSIVILVTAEDNVTTMTYTVSLNRYDGILRKITSVNYGHIIIDDKIETVKDNIKPSVMKDQLDNNKEELQIWTSDLTREINADEKVGTAMFVRLMIDQVENDRKVIVVKGDTSGDGDINLFDAVKILNHYLEKSKLSGAYLEAGLISEDDSCDLFDAVKVLNHYLGIKLIH